ncbi:hypothetical protein [Alkaliphilus hydrothermalis]|uniref:ABC-2 type transport system permease protein n=1 Tax=Alkaliphilus hydrothermalis TaxID=1482730 RepID=A0ABS2NN53_9FIRM|nr:hypothetical protein [Alkaliphilus hydrothermalis]MBM7614286.1 ABC-2 type transport system permease protein [Alkaliphilus hydrothermalis]
MHSFKAYFKKEILEGMRTYRYIIIASVFIGFAIFTPMMLKMLPSILESQGDGIDYSQLMKVTQTSALQNYMGNILQLGTLVVVLSLMGIVAEEVKNHLFVMPTSKELSFTGVILSKGVHYSILVSILIPIAMTINYYYVAMLFEDGVVTLQQTLSSAFHLTCYFIFIIHLLICIGSYVKKSGVVATITMLVLLAMPLLNKINALSKVLPYYFIEAATKVSNLDSSVFMPLLVLSGYIVLLNGMAIHRLKTRELE